MREIKFRGKRRDNGEWLYGDLMHVNEQVIINPIFDEPYEYDGNFDANVDPKTVGEYTGLKDKNGKEIWEGDILKTVGEANAQVIFSQGAFCGKEINGWDVMTEYYPLAGNVDNSEVISNIYDHPHLLEKGADG